MIQPWSGLEDALAGTAIAPWSNVLASVAQAALKDCRHGDMDRWLTAIEDLLEAVGRKHTDLKRDAPVLGEAASEHEQLRIRDCLMALHPWRKGPLCLGGVFIDSEWRSDWKWARIAPHVDLTGEVVLDVGSGNGYFGWRMLGAGAQCVVGIDPTWVYVMQWLAQRCFAGDRHNYVLPLTDLDLPEGISGFDTVASMGVLYHQRDSQAHFQRLHSWVRRGGRLILETLVLDRSGLDCLTPQGRYARMRNVWRLPTPGWLMRRLDDAGFRDIRLVDLTATSTEEQRSTQWMRFESLAQCLDPQDPSRTVEGHPAPVRAVLLANA